MTRFKLKPGIKITAQDESFIVTDEETRSTFRVGHVQYLILKELGKATDLEDLAYALRTASGLKIPADKLNQFIQRGMSLDIIKAVSDSFWGRARSLGAFSAKTKLFDPDAFLGSTVSLFRCSKYLVLLGPGLFVAAALILNALYIRDLWVVRSLQMPPYGPIVLLFIYASCVGHELFHGLAAKSVGFEVPELGVHWHYCVPSFYCKILTPSNPDRKKVGLVLLAGSVFDLATISVLVFTWRFWHVSQNFSEMIAYAISLIWLKILLIQLNPLFPLSDGNRIAGVLLSRKRGQSQSA